MAKIKFNKKDDNVNLDELTAFDTAVIMSRTVKVYQYMVEAARQALGNLFIDRRVPDDLKRIAGFYMGYLEGVTALIDVTEFLPDPGAWVIAYFPEENRFADVMYTEEGQWIEPLPAEVKQFTSIVNAVHPSTAVSHWLIRPGEPTFKDEEE